MTPRNAIVVMTDDQAAASLLGHDGSVDARGWPWLAGDVSAGPWVRLPNALLSTPLCHPARASLHTGQRSDINGKIYNAAGEPPWDHGLQLGRVLDAAGAAAGFVGKYLNAWGGSWGGGGAPRGWRYWRATKTDNTMYGWLAEDDDGATLGDPGGVYLTDQNADWCAEFLGAALPAPEPWCLVWCPNAPHNPYTPATAYASTAVTWSDPPDFGLVHPDMPAWVIAKPALSAGAMTGYRNDEQQVRRMSRSLDDALAAIVGQVQAAGRLDETAVVVWTDNGYPNGRKRFAGADGEARKKNPYRFSSGAQMLVRWPGATPRVDPRIVSTLDVSATLYDIFAAEPDKPTSGISLRTIMESPGALGRRSAEALYAGDPGTTAMPGTGGMVPWWAILDDTVSGATGNPADAGPWKYVEYPATPDHPAAEAELYHWTADPDEMTPLHLSRPDVVEWLAPRLAALRADPHAFSLSAQKVRAWDGQEWRAAKMRLRAPAGWQEEMVLGQR